MVSTRLRWRLFRPWIEKPCSRVLRKLSGELTTIQYCAVRPPPDFRLRLPRPCLAGRCCSVDACSTCSACSTASTCSTGSTCSSSDTGSVPPPRFLTSSRPRRPGACGAEGGVKGPGAASSRIYRCAPSRATPSLAPAADAANFAAALRSDPLVARTNKISIAVPTGALLQGSLKLLARAHIARLSAPELGRKLLVQRNGLRVVAA